MRSCKILTPGLLAGALCIWLEPPSAYAHPMDRICPSPFVCWKVDHSAQTITVTVKLAFYTGPEFHSSIDGTVKAFTRAIGAVWSGHRFKCYNLVVVVIDSIVPTGDQVPPDALGIRVDYGSVPIRSRVARERPTSHAPDKPLSDDPLDRFPPASSDDWGPTTWGATATEATIAHEFGHVLGLNDGYIERLLPEGIRPERRPGATRDLMSEFISVSPEMITKAVRRSGIDESQIRCPMLMTVGPEYAWAFLVTIEGFRLRAYVCDYDPPSEDPLRRARPMNFVGRVSYEGTHVDVFRWAPPAFRTERYGGMPFMIGRADIPIRFKVDLKQATVIKVAQGFEFVAEFGYGSDGVLYPIHPLHFNNPREDASFLFGRPVYPEFSLKPSPPECAFR